MPASEEIIAAPFEETSFAFGAGGLLQGTRFTPSSPPGVAVSIHGATGVPARTYGRFARFLASHGLGVVTYDYRGIGRSRPPGSLRSCEVSVASWGHDAADALDACEDLWPAARQTAVGHSIGGFVLGLTPRSARLHRVVGVAAQTAYPGDFARSLRLPLFLLFHVFMPVVTRAVGYFPASRLGLGEDLPAGIARDWAARGSIADVVPTVPLSQRHFEALGAEMLSWHVADDPFATRRAIERLERLFVRARITSRTITSVDAGRSLGHLGFLRGEPHAGWHETLAFLRGVSGHDERASRQ